jgi:hypothetical protein
MVWQGLATGKPSAKLLDIAGFEEHVPLEDRHISTKAVGPSGLYLSEMRNRFFLLCPTTQSSKLSHVSGRDLRTMLWRETKSQRPRHDPAGEPLPTWVTDWHAAYDSGADISTYEGALL